MLVSAHQTSLTPIPKKPGDTPNEDATNGVAGGLQGPLIQALQNNVQAQTAQASEVQASATRIATQQVNEASKISDNVDEAFAKTRVNLQQTMTPLKSLDGFSERVASQASISATDEFKEYMSKSPEERLQDAILEDMGLTEEEVAAMPPEQQQAVSEEIAKRMTEMAEIAKVEEAQRKSEKQGSESTDSELASV